MMVQQPPLVVRPPDAFNYFSSATCCHDNSGFTFCTTCGTDDSSFDLRAMRGSDDFSRHLLDSARLATDRPTGASRAAGWCSPHLFHGSSASDADSRGCRLPATKLYIITTLSPIPKLVWATLDDPQWRAAMAEEYATLMSNNTWDLVPRPRDANVVIDMWKFKHKFNDDKTLERYKARRVLHGFMQRPNVDL
jgi:hypothetical protein